jgi:hypothetical protein
MKRPQLLALSTTVATTAMVIAGALAASAPAAAASTVSCRTTISGGLVGTEVVASSNDVLAEAAAGPQRVLIDGVSVNAFGQTRYRLAAPIRLVTVHGAVPTTFKGGTGYFVQGESLRLSSTFQACVGGLGT